MVTLPEYTSVQKVRILNRGDCCGKRLDGFDVYVPAVCTGVPGSKILLEDDFLHSNFSLRF